MLGIAECNVPEPIALGDLLQLRAGIGDGDEARSRLARRRPPLRALEEILLQDIRLERAAGLARHDEERSGRIDRAFDGPDLRRIGRIEHQQLGAAGLLPERLGQHLRSEARSAHAEKQDVGEALLPDVRRPGLRARRSGLRCSSTMSSQPSHFASSAPVQSAASPAHSRRTLPSRRQASSEAATAFSSSGGSLHGLAVELVAEHARRACRRPRRAACRTHRRRAARLPRPASPSPRRSRCRTAPAPPSSARPGRYSPQGSAARLP